jgi:hypothetical protein
MDVDPRRNKRVILEGIEMEIQAHGFELSAPHREHV